MLNQCNFIGNLGQDPEVKYLPNGDCVVNLSIACTEKWKDKQTGQQQEKTEWVRLVAFRQLAEICSKFLKKGDKIYASGKMRTRSWETDAGEKRYATDIAISDMKMLTSKGEGQGQQNAQGGSQGASGGRTPPHSPPPQGTTNAGGKTAADFDFDGDMPF